MMIPLNGYQVFPVKTRLIFADEEDFNCRGDFTAQSVNDLADSIKDFGKLLDPIWLQPRSDVSVGWVPTKFQFRIIAGHRRFRAVTTVLKWHEIPARIIPGLTDQQARMLNLTENLERKDLTPFEEARAIGRIFSPEVSIGVIAKTLKRDSRWVKSRLLVARSAPEIQDLIHARRLTLLQLEETVSQYPAEEQVVVATKLAQERKGQGKKQVTMYKGKKLERTFKRRRSKYEINRRISHQLDLGLSGLSTASLAWAAGYISDQELDTEEKSIRVTKRRPKT